MDYTPLRHALRLARTIAPREDRDRPGLTLDEAAAASGINRATIHSIENTKNEADYKPRLDTIQRLAETYGVDLSVSIRQREQHDESGLDSSGKQRGTSEPRVAVDDSSTASASVEIARLQAEVAELRAEYKLLVRAVQSYTGELESHHQHDSGARSDAPKHGPAARTLRPRTVPRKTLKRQRKR